MFCIAATGYRPPKNEMTFDTAKPSLRGLFRIG